MKKSVLFIVIILIAVIPLVYLGIVYHSLPSVVATHYSINGKPNGFSSKTSLVIIIALLSALTVGVYILNTSIYKIDPKKTAKLSRDAMQKIAFGIVVLVNAISIIIIYSGAHNSFTLDKVMLPLFGLFFTYLGNLMHSLKPNYFVGIRTPWALEDEDTWRKTHQLAGKLWFAGGLLITVISLLAPPLYGVVSMISITLLITLVPTIFSYRYYQLHRTDR